MANKDGKQLEQLVAHVERRLLGQGFEVRTNTRVCDEEGVPVAEFDIEIHGRVGSTNFSWLIECRDRPSGGAAPVSWIEQLYGRRSRFNFNKVTAVSTSGFSKAAVQYAREVGIELREAMELTPDSFDGWLQIEEFRTRFNRANLIHATFFPAAETPVEQQEALREVIEGQAGDERVLRKVLTNEVVTPSEAFLGVINQNNVFQQMNVEPGAPPKAVHLEIHYEKDDHFAIDTALGPVRLQTIVFEGELLTEEDVVPIIGGTEYRQTEDGTVIAQVVRFATQQIGDMKVGVEFQRIESTGEIQVILRKR